MTFKALEETVSRYRKRMANIGVEMNVAPGSRYTYRGDPAVFMHIVDVSNGTVKWDGGNRKIAQSRFETPIDVFLDWMVSGNWILETPDVKHSRRPGL